jgi:REP element-mobilizing transposase RayT
MRKLRKLGIGEFYHIYNRGVEKRDIFLDEADRQHFLRLLFMSNGAKSFVMRESINISLGDFDRGEPITSIGEYCLMTNHFHLLLKETTDGGISAFMKKLCVAYSMYFNKKYKRTGHLFQGRFEAIHAGTDTYLKYLYSYIHLNPVKMIDPGWKERGITNPEKAKAFLAQYKYSSLADYQGIKRPENIILTKKDFPEYFQTKKDVDYHINSWLTLKDSQ